MSEFSTSYHIRVDNARDVEKLLRNAKFAGITFGPAHGWLSFVPYANSTYYENGPEAQFAIRLSKVTGRPVIYYCYAEDHGWTFALARPDHPLVQYGGWWDPSPTVDRDQFDPLALAPFVAIELLEPLLQSVEPEVATRIRPAYQFAELLGFPAYKWLSPDLAQNHTDDFLKQGGRKLGTKPLGLAAQLGLPSNRQIGIPHPDLTASEALELILPFMARFKTPWSLTELYSGGRIRPDGRGDWAARWRYGESGDTVEVALFGNGKISFRGDTTPPSVVGFLLKQMVLPERWIDSPDIAAIVARLPLPNGIVQPLLGLMTLRSFNDVPLAWEVYFSTDQPAKSQFVSWIVCVDAISGEILGEQLGRRDGYMVVSSRQRVGDGEWEDIDP